MKGEQITITIRSNGTCSFQWPVETRFGKKPVVGVIEDEGTWKLFHNPKDHFKNSLHVYGSKVGTSFYVALHSQKVVLWRYWGDPDEEIHLVYEKVKSESE